MNDGWRVFFLRISLDIPRVLKLLKSSFMTRTCLCLLLILRWQANSWAHNDPKEDATKPSETISNDGASAALLCARATRWRTLRKVDLAIKDWTLALELDPTSFEAAFELTKTYVSTGNLKKGFAVVNASLDGKIADASGQARLHMLRALINTLWKSYKNAGKDCDQAFELQPTHGRIDWYLKRAYVQRMQGLFQACEVGLKEGYAAIPSTVLYIEWVESLIDAKQYEAALKEVEAQLPGLRFSAPWQIRLAKALRGLKRNDGAKIALENAERELDSSIEANAKQLDITLRLDRANLRLLLGQRKGAQQDYQMAKKAGADGWMLWRFEKAFR